MKRKLNKLLLCLLLLLVTVIPVQAQAQGNITVTLAERKQPQSGIKLSLCQIATMEGESFYPAAPFAESGMDLAALINRPDATFAEDLHRYVQKHKVSCKTTVSDADGAALFEGLPRGIYLIFCESTKGYTFKPYLVFLPQTIGGESLYTIHSEPKIEALPEPTPSTPAPKPEPTPDTGDHSNSKLWNHLLVLSGSGILILLCLKNRIKL